MSWTLVTVMESENVDLPPEVTMRAKDVLTGKGWQEPGIGEFAHPI